MTLSRTSRILIAILLLAAATFFWVNFFYQKQAFVAASEGGDGPQRVAAAPAASDRASTTGVAPASGGEVPNVALPAEQSASRRALVVADLPFLVTEPLPLAVDADAAADSAGASRADGARRASINPFAPVIAAPQPQPEVAAQPQPAAPAATAEPQVVEVSVPQAPEAAVLSAARAPVSAPAPRPLAPPSPQARNLPRSLPSGSMPSTPDILRDARVAPRRIPAEQLVLTAAIREPDARPAARFEPLGGEPLPAAPATLPGLLGPSERPVRTSIGAQRDPLVAGVSPLSSYLRDNNYAFTGSVLGPVSVGVFRSALSPVPVVIGLGQTLPDTDIVLTDLRGQQAELQLDDHTQTLILDLRR